MVVSQSVQIASGNDIFSDHLLDKNIVGSGGIDFGRGSEGRRREEEKRKEEE
jgi:hypothetical protein